MKEIFLKTMPKLILAPMRGFTDATFRTVYARHFSGIDTAVSPFITSVKGRKIKPTHIKDVAPENNPLMPVIPQILSKDADEFITLASAFKDLGYGQVNWNLGCPYPMVAKKGRGSGLLPFPEKVDRILTRVVPEIPMGLSIKTRLGRFSASEIQAIMSVFNQHTLSELIVHPRTGIQMYDGCVDLDAMMFCVKNSMHPVVYNGDINTLDDFNTIYGQFDTVTGWMLGRGVLRDPFLPETIKGICFDPGNRRDRFRDFHDDLFEQYQMKLYGSSHVLDRMKGLWGYFENNFHPNKKLFKTLRKATSIKKYMQSVALLLSEAFSNHGFGKL